MSARAFIPVAGVADPGSPSAVGQGADLASEEPPKKAKKSKASAPETPPQGNADANEAEAVGAASPEPAYSVEVRYGVPETFTNIIERQFEMMQEWTKQSFTAEKLKTEEMQYLNVQINSLADSYRHLIETLKKNKNL